jgi:hypothetical protein
MIGKKEKAESKCINATLKLDQAQATLLEAQEAMNAMSKNRRAQPRTKMQLKGLRCRHVGKNFMQGSFHARLARQLRRG